MRTGTPRCFELQLPAPLLLLVAAFVIHGMSFANGRKEAGNHRSVKHVPMNAPITVKSPRQLRTAYEALPLTFEPNKGQTDPSVDFISHGAGYTAFLTANEVVVSQQEPEEADRLLEKMDARTRKRFEARRFYQASPRFHRRQKTRNIRVALEGANPSPGLLALDQLSGKANYFVGHDPRQWLAGIPTYAKVQYSAIYPGIDLVYYGKRGRLEFDFVVSPDTDPKAIRLRFDAATRILIAKDGNLLIFTDQGSFELHCPEIYQIRGGKRIPVRGRFAVNRDERSVGIQLANYDRHTQLVIDPVLTYSTYVGGSGTDYDSGVAVDVQGNAYIAGMTNSSNFPTHNGYQSSGDANGVAFVTELNPTGTAILYSTYLGGSGGDWAAGMALDTSGRVYITGGTMSSDFPMVNAFQTSLGSSNGNAFVAVVDPSKSGTASLVYSTYLGGGGNASNSLGDVGLAIAANASGYAYVTGQTASDSSSAAFPTTSNALQSALASTNGNAFLTVLDTTYGGATSLLYSTYLGGASGGFGDYGLGITVDSLGNAYLTGQTTSGGSGPFPTTASAYQSTLNSQYGNVFLTELANGQNGSRPLAYSTYLGGSSGIIVGDTGSSIGLDSTGKVYVAGDTTSADFPVTSGAFQTTNSAGGKAFVAAFDPTQTGIGSLVYSTLLGGTDGSEGEVANALAVDSKGNAFVVGSTSSSDFPTSSDAYQNTIKNSSWDAFLTEIDPTGASILYSTYFGGGCSDGDLGNGVALDPGGNVHLSGATCSPDLPTTAGAYQTSLAGTRNAFVADIPLPTSVVSIQLSPQNVTLIGGTTQQFSLIATLSNGNTEDVTGSAVWSSSDPSVLTVATLAQTRGFGVAVSVGTANVTAILGTLTASTNVTVSGTPTLAITSISPTSGKAGTQVTVSGAGFGASQGGGYLWLGTTYGIISSWSDTQIVATVAAISTSGVVQVVQGALQSNSVSFTIATPTITSVLPTSGVVGTQVTITGSGFGATQGNGQVWLGSTNGIVNSWSDTQVVSTVASGSTSGNAQILQGGVWSNPIAFTVSTPVIRGITPSSGNPGTSVTIAGSGFGASQGSGTVWIGGTNAVVASWSDTQVVATVGTNAVSGIAKVQQSGIWSNAVGFTVPLTAGSGPQITLVPSVLSMAVGETRSIQALDSNNQPVAGLTWTSSDTTIVTLSTDDPPILTAVAAGNVTIFAGSASADVTVYSGPTLPAGSLIWSNLGDGSGVSGIIPAVPSSTGVADVFALNNSGLLQAIKPDGMLGWAADLSNVINSPNQPYNGQPLVIADFRGGAVAYTGISIYSLDGLTGRSNPAYVGSSTLDQYYAGISFPTLTNPLVHTDGTIFTIDSSCTANDCGVNLSNDNTTGSFVVAIDPTSGQPKFKVQADNSSSLITSDAYCGGPGTQTIHRYPITPYNANQMIIAGDGYFYTTYMTMDSVETDTQAATLPYSLGAYWRFVQLETDFSAGNVAAELSDLSALLAPGTPSNAAFGIEEMQAFLNNGDNVDAGYALIDAIAPYFPQLCNQTSTVVSKYHLLRVGTDGSSADTVLGQWTQNSSLIYSPTHGDPYNYTHTQSAPFVGGYSGQLITNADQGVLVTWREQRSTYCALATDSGCVTYANDAPRYHLTTITGGQVTGDVVANQVPGQNSPINPVLQRQDGSFLGTVSGNSGNSMVAFDASGNIKYIRPNYNPVIATADGGVIAQSSDGSSTATFDANGNAIGQLQASISGVPFQSWLGNEYVYGSVEQVHTPAVFEDGASWTPQVGGNPSGNGTAILQCPCLLQASLTSSNPVSAVGNKTYVIMSGDPGLNLGNGHNHNVGRLFDLAAETLGNSLVEAGNNTVITNRISSISDFGQALSSNGLINGSITYFGHAGIDTHGNYALFPGQNPGDSNNVSVLNISQLSNTNLSQSATVTLNACHAGLGGRSSIAQILANQLKRTVFAYPVDMYFSSDPTPRRFRKGMTSPGGVPVYMVPNGDGVQPTAFTPQVR